MSKVLLSGPDVGVLEEQYVLAALQSGWVAPLGPDVDLFEREMADRVGAEHAIALSSGTAALHLGLLVAGVQPGDAVITSSMTFAATANAISYTGAKPVFIDCERETGNMDPELLETALVQLVAEGVRPAAVVPVDLLGKTVNYTDICRLAAAYDIPVISDAAESLGATHRGQAAGSWGLASAFSFNGNKIMTTSGGGMLTTNNGDVAAKTRYLATQARQPVLHYEHTEIGYNYRLSNILAALGRAQLSRLDSMIAVRRRHRRAYHSHLQGIAGVELFGGEDYNDDNCWLSAIVIDPVITGLHASELQIHLAATGIESRPLWKPMHLQPVFEGQRALVNGNSQYLFENGLTLPSGSVLKDDDISRVLEALDSFFAVRRA
ncbi:DegT/DnrJ/EryC1/StrS aminotransferase family protein [Pseudarthrobacter sp. SSS035]|uniref:DegT/DnrJ/EryC1/StrS family aminotransferase n=1 Tax=Pseudarthrobacter sp. SSS035 TaxID=2931399 RepID=UPI0020101966|nr:aminotransferase class I/II-fold pyridoxal phosphate-dependent enzyme [Pseudarthrobacter sp. SSS035]